MCRLLSAAVLLFGLSIAAFAQETRPASTAPRTLLTIYSSARVDDFDAAGLMKGAAKHIPGMGIVQQRRTLELSEDSVVQLPQIVPSADFATLSLRPVSPDAFRVLSQSMIEPAIDPDALLRRAIGHEVIINRKAPLGDHGRTPETINAKLLAFDQNQIVIETGNHQLPVQIIPRNSEIAEIKLMADGTAPMSRAALSARLIAAKAGPQEAIITYQASGMTWHADYDIFLHE